MIPLQRLQAQHREILDLLHSLSVLIADPEARRTGVTARLFAELAQLVSEHLALEDDTLYRELLVHPDPQLQRTARDFLASSHGLRKRLAASGTYPCTPEASAAECEKFVVHSRELFDQLRNRIEIEEERLYPLVTD